MVAKNTFPDAAPGRQDSAMDAFAVTTDDTNPLPFVTRSLYVGVTGDVSAILDGDTVAVVFKNVPQGTFMPIRATQVKATGTTATNLVGLY